MECSMEMFLSIGSIKVSICNAEISLANKLRIPNNLSYKHINHSAACIFTYVKVLSTYK